MDCNNNDGSTNYLYQMQQTMNNSTGNGMMNSGSMNSMGSSSMQQPLNYDKKSFDLATSNSYLNGHSVTPTSMAGGQYSNHTSLTSPAASSCSTNSVAPSGQRTYPDYNTFNGSTGNYYAANNFDRNQFTSTMNAPPPPQAAPPAQSQSSNANHHTHLNSQTNHLLNNHHSISQTGQTKQTDARSSSQPMSYMSQLNETGGNNSVMYNQQQHAPNNHHHPSLLPPHHLANNQLPIHQRTHHLANANQQAHTNIRPHAGQAPSHLPNHHVNFNHPHHPQQPFHQQTPPQHLNQYNNPANSMNNGQQQSVISGYPNQFYNNYNNNTNNNGDQWRFQHQMTPTSSPPNQRMITQQPNSQVQMNSMPNNNATQSSASNQTPLKQLDGTATNLNNSVNLSQPYANMHISNPMNNSMNSSMNNVSMNSSSHVQQQQQQQHAASFNATLTNNGGATYMTGAINSYSSYTPSNVDSHQQASQHPQSQYLASPPPSNHQQYQHPMQIPSPHLKHHQPVLTTLQTPNNSQSSASSMHNSGMKTHLSALDETLDSVVNGTSELSTSSSIKPKRRRGKGKQPKDKGGKKEVKQQSAYALFFKKTQEELKRSNPKMPFGEISKTVANRWSLLSDEHKQGYKSITDKERKYKLEEMAKEKAMKVSAMMGELPSDLDDSLLSCMKNDEI